MSEFRNDTEGGLADEREPVDINQLVLVLQIICASLIGGVLIFGGFVLLQPHQPPAENPVMAFVAVAFTAADLVAWFVLGWSMDRAAAKQVSQLPRDDGPPDADAVATALMPRYQTRKILQMAMLEGAAFVNLVAYWLDRAGWTLAIIGGLVLLMLIGFPTRGRVYGWARSLIQRWEARRFDGGER